MRKLLSLLLVAVMVLGLVGTAFAAGFPDVTVEAQQAPSAKLKALGVMIGDPDGNLRPNDSITRAEAAATVVRLMGLDAAAKLINAQPKFKDVGADVSWAWGYISVAADKGIIVGDPDGKFRPKDPVNYAEVATMLLRAANWGTDCSQIAWPAGFIMKATEFGLTDDTNFDALKPATRGDVAIMANATLGVVTAKFNDTTNAWEATGPTVLASYLKAIDVTARVLRTPVMDSTLLANQAVIEGYGKLTLPAGTDVNALLGHKVNFIKYNSSSTLPYVADATDAADIVTGVATADATNLDGVTVEVGTTELHYDVYSEVVSDVTQAKINVVTDWGTTATPTDTNMLDDVDVFIHEDDNVTLFLQDNRVRFAIVTTAGIDGLVTAKAVKGVDDATADSFTVGGTEYTLLPTTVITKNGAKATFADLAVGDVAYIVADAADRAVTVDLYNKAVTGTVSAVGYNSKGEAQITMGGTVYTIRNDAFTSDVKLNGSAITKAALGGLIGSSVTAYADKDGMLAVVKASRQLVIGKVVSNTEVVADTDYQVLKFNIKGTEKSYTVLDTAVPAGVATLVAGDYVQIAFASNGTDVLSVTERSSATGYTVKAIDATNKVVTLQNAGVNSVLPYYDNAYGIIGGTWGDISSLKVGDVIDYVLDGTNTIAYFEGSTTAVTTVAGKFINATNIDGVDTVYVQVNGTVKAYAWDNASAFSAPAGTYFIALTFNPVDGKVTAVVGAWDKDGVDKTASGTGLDFVAASSPVSVVTGSLVRLNDGTLLDLSNASVYKTYVAPATEPSSKTVAGITAADTLRCVTDGAGDIVLVLYTAN